MNISSTSFTQPKFTNYSNLQNNTTGQAQPQTDAAQANESSGVKKGHHGHHAHHAQGTESKQQVQNTSAYSATPGQQPQSTSPVVQSSTIDFTA
ncbi:hypothetical protein [Aneurinibacillus terranovensis]|uniref:hypothetical protein n=1 Tax=Aneurinibacillus terranovensis TaxID=278991 RepID=UPI00040C0C30|nr:hypothetical protein [Aneurinibacillus terranovensis]